MATNNYFLTADLQNSFQNARKLSDIDSKYDPTTEPYKSKYEARKLVCSLYEEICEQVCPDAAPMSVSYTVALASLDLFLGINYISTDEASTGEEHLKKCIDKLEEICLDAKCCAVMIEALNHLGILYSDRSLLEKSLSLLSRAEKLYIDFKHDVGGFPNILYDMFDNDSGDDCNKFISKEKKREDHFEDTYTHTLYYIAQVHASLQNNSKSAEYCHETLRRQLKSFKYDPIDWAMNAATLSQYYMINNQFYMARHCLASATVILTEEGEPQTKVATSTGDSEDLNALEKLPRAWANLYRCFVKYGLALMEVSRSRLLHEISDDAEATKPDDHNADKKCEESSNLPEDETSVQQKPDVLFDLELTRVENQITDKYLLTFDQARLVFLRLQEWLNKAKEYYTIDEHCSDYIEIIQDNSNLYQQLAFYEMDFQRQCQMHKKRVDLLLNLNKELNPQYFLLVNRQLVYEIAEIYMAMLDLKLAIIEESNEPPNAHGRKKINQLTSQSIEQYNAYLDTLKGTDKMMPDKLAEEDERPALVAWFCMGRLHSKFIEFEPRKRIENIEHSTEYYKKLVDYCNLHASARDKMKQEFEICAEMVELLPAKIRQIASRM